MKETKDGVEVGLQKTIGETVVFIGGVDRGGIIFRGIGVIIDGRTYFEGGHDLRIEALWRGFCIAKAMLRIVPRSFPSVLEACFYAGLNGGRTHRSFSRAYIALGTGYREFHDMCRNIVGGEDLPIDVKKTLGDFFTEFVGDSLVQSGGCPRRAFLQTSGKHLGITLGAT